MTPTSHVTLARPSAPSAGRVLLRLILPVITFVIAVVVVIVGALMVTTMSASLVAALDSGAATATDVYAGQSMIGVAAAVLAAGIVGVILALVGLSVLIGVGALSSARRDGAEPDADDVDGADDLGLGENEPGVGATDAAEDPARTTTPSA
jgi:hypothetical protein